MASSRSKTPRRSSKVRSRRQQPTAASGELTNNVVLEVKGTSAGPRGRRELLRETLRQRPELVSYRPKEELAYGYGSTKDLVIGVKGVHSIVEIKGTPMAGEWIRQQIPGHTGVLRQYFFDPRERASAIGASPGERLTADAAKQVLRRIAEGSTDLFSTIEKAESYLQTPNFAGTGGDALRLIRSGGAATVIARLDELRFGPQG